MQAGVNASGWVPVIRRQEETEGNIISSTTHTPDDVWRRWSNTTIVTITTPMSPPRPPVLSGVAIFSIILGILITLLVTYLLCTIWRSLYQCRVRCQGQHEQQRSVRAHTCPDYAQALRHLCWRAWSCQWFQISSRHRELDPFNSSDQFQHTQSTSGNRSFLDRVADRLNGSQVTHTSQGRYNDTSVVSQYSMHDSFFVSPSLHGPPSSVSYVHESRLRNDSIDNRSLVTTRKQPHTNRLLEFDQYSEDSVLLEHRPSSAVQTQDWTWDQPRRMDDIPRQVKITKDSGSDLVSEDMQDDHPIQHHTNHHPIVDVPFVSASEQSDINASGGHPQGAQPFIYSFGEKTESLNKGQFLRSGYVSSESDSSPVKDTKPSSLLVAINKTYLKHHDSWQDSHLDFGQLTDRVDQFNGSCNLGNRISMSAPGSLFVSGYETNIVDVGDVSDSSAEFIHHEQDGGQIRTMQEAASLARDEKADVFLCSGKSGALSKMKYSFSVDRLQTSGSKGYCENFHTQRDETKHYSNSRERINNESNKYSNHIERRSNNLERLRDFSNRYSSNLERFRNEVESNINFNRHFINLDEMSDGSVRYSNNLERLSDEFKRCTSCRERKSSSSSNIYSNNLERLRDYDSSHSSQTSDSVVNRNIPAVNRSSLPDSRPSSRPTSSLLQAIINDLDLTLPWSQDGAHARDSNDP